jgi:subtilisin family serine protease
VRALGNDGSSETAYVIAAIDYIVKDAKDKKAVVNMSLGTKRDDILDQAITAAIASNVPFVVSAGNDANDACLKSPARVRTAITVASTGPTDTHSSFSNYGECVDIYAPGENITSTWKKEKYKNLSGTSMSAPHVAGVAALYLGMEKGMTPNELLEIMQRDAWKNAVKKGKPKTPNMLAAVVV